MVLVTNMMMSKKKRFLTVLLLWFLVVGGTASHGGASPYPSGNDASFFFPCDDIIRQGQHEIAGEPEQMEESTFLLQKLESWYNTHPLIEFASLVETTITVKFIDGSYMVIMDMVSDKKDPRDDSSLPHSQQYSQVSSNHTAVVLNADEYLYGHHQCKKIISTLLKKDYMITYRANEAVDLSFIRHNLSADIVYMNTHAG